jgi:hypothetical protein
MIHQAKGQPKKSGRHLVVFIAQLVMVALKSYRKNSDSRFFKADFSAKINYKATAPANDFTQIR